MLSTELDPFECVLNVVDINEMANTAQTESNNIKQKIYNITQDTHDYTPQIHNVKQEINNITIEANSYRICTQEQLEYLAFVDKHPELLQNKISSANPKQLKKLWEELAGNFNSMAEEIAEILRERLGYTNLHDFKVTLSDAKFRRADLESNSFFVYYGGYHGYCSKTPLVGNVDEEGCYLVKTTEECLNDCISLCRPNVEFNAKSIAFAITKQQSKRVIPILTFGGPEVEIEKNGWAATTLDGARTAQFDHTILITETGAEVLTKPS
ncbi:hypothetical protein GQX74_009584 [Glossina fuscipes]|nr:hypothetical protein GQX74_009584 [Glossina fuscipes]